MEIVTYRVVARGIDKPYVEIPEGVTHIGERAFGNLEDNTIQHVKLPSTLLGIGEQAFQGCNELLSVDFSECRDLVDIGDFAFAECYELRHVNLSNCVKLKRFEEGVFDECLNLTLHVPRTIKYFGVLACGNVQAAAFSSVLSEGQHNDVLTYPEYLLLPKSTKPEFDWVRVLSKRVPFWVDDYDRYADVFDAIGELNVIWVESLRRQGKIRSTGWTSAFIVQESEIRNHVIDLWNRVNPFNVSNGSKTLFEAATDNLIADGRRLVAMQSYQTQPEETKIFKNILESYNIREPTRASPAKKARRLMANLRL